MCQSGIGERSTNENASIAVQIFDEFAGAISPPWLEAVCRVVLMQEGIAQHVSLVIADDDTVRALNAEYRGLDKTTDGLSFAFDNAGEYYGEDDAPSRWSADEEFVLPPGESAGLGEVIVSYPQAVRQAQQAGHPVERELAFLVIHGILHLIGHDHMYDDDARAMQDKERRAMERVAAHGVRGSNG
ncbi:MAG: rRNA maturation RNase YbeY [Chloroflexi bacterium]|nr:rRNA maturation RNase YbeY [Chloroflexota bacterium]